MGASLALAACSAGIPQRNPELPPGFAEALLPNVETIGYLYVKQSQPFLIPTSHFTDASLLQETLPPQLALTSLVLLAGPETPKDFSGILIFAEPLHAELAGRALEQKTVEGEHPWFQHSGTELHVTSGAGAQGSWAAALQEAVTQGRGTRLEEKDGGAWQTIRMLPEDAPGEPIAAGFVHMDRKLLESLAAQATLNLDNLISAVGATRVTTASFAVYADQPVQLPEQPSETFFKEAGLSAVFIARSQYPGLLFSFFFNTFAGRADLQAIDLGDGKTARQAQFGALHLIVKNLGNTLIFTLAADQERALELMRSTLP